ncbi:MAG: hypothetical protein RIS54_1762, partial [Verrucomicrobiota bacterium]
MELIDGNQIAATIIAELKAGVAAQKGRKPCIALVRVGDDHASVSYVRKKEKTAAEIGIESRIILPPVDIRQADLERIIDDLNADHT